MFLDILDQNPKIHALKLDLQQRNHSAMDSYKKLGFRIVSEKYQPVWDTQELYYILAV